MASNICSMSDQTIKTFVTEVVKQITPLMSHVELKPLMETVTSLTQAVGSYIALAQDGKIVSHLSGGGEFATVFAQQFFIQFQDLAKSDKDPIMVSAKKAFEAIGETLGNSLASGYISGLVKHSPELGVAGAVVLGGTVAGGIISYYGLTRWFEQPKLINEERRLTGLSSLYRAATNKVSSAWGKKAEKKITIPPVFNEDVSRKVKDFTKGITYLQRNGGYFQNALFYGPGGVGKTMICDKIAEDANVNFIKMSGGNLAECLNKGTHVAELNKLFDYMEASSLPTVFFVDEAEALCSDRSRMSGPDAPKRLELIDAFLNRTGIPSKKIILLMSTNRVKDLDPAVLSRMDYKFRIDPPALSERVKMISDYVPKFFTGNDRTLFTQEKIEWIAENTEHASGRAIYKMLNTMNVKKAGTARNLLTDQMIEQTVLDCMAEEKDLEISKQEP